MTDCDDSWVSNVLWMSAAFHRISMTLFFVTSLKLLLFYLTIISRIIHWPNVESIFRRNKSSTNAEYSWSFNHAADCHQNYDVHSHLNSNKSLTTRKEEEFKNFWPTFTLACGWVAEWVCTTHLLLATHQWMVMAQVKFWFFSNFTSTEKLSDYVR